MFSNVIKELCKIQFYTKNIKIIYQSIIQLLTKKGSSNVTVIDTSDSFCLNAVVEGSACDYA